MCVQPQRWLTVTARQSLSHQSLKPRFNSCGWQDVGITGPARPSVPSATTHGDSLAFGRGVSPPLQWPVPGAPAGPPVHISQRYPETCPRCIFHGGMIRYPSRVVVAPSRPLGNAVRADRTAWIAARFMPTPPTRRSAVRHQKKSMDKAAKLAMLSYGDTKCVDLWESEAYCI